MIVGSIARRYAKALFGLAVEQGKIDAWSASLSSLQQAIERSPELRDVLQNPIYTKEQRRGIVTKLVAALSLEAQPANLLFLLGDRARLAELASIVSEFGALADAKAGRLRARVVSAAPLDPGAVQHITDRLAAATKAQVILDRVVDPELIGGVVAQVGRLTYDGSIRSQLEDLRRSLKQ